MANFIGLETIYQAFDKKLEPLRNETGHFNIFKVEDILTPQTKPVAYTRRNFYKISLVAGHSKIHYADQSFEVNGSVLVFTNPAIPYHWQRISEEHQGYVCVFTEGFLSRFGSIKDYPVFQSAGAAIIQLDDAVANVFDARFIRIYQELQGDYAYKYDLLRNLLMEVMHEAQKMHPIAGVPATGANAAERIASLFADLLERQYPIEMSNQVIWLKTPSDFAAQLNVHVNHLNKALKDTTGQTTTQLINVRLLQEAKTLLKTTSWTINEIAWCLGFEEPNHFSGFFKTKLKTTPKAFRQAVID